MNMFSLFRFFDILQFGEEEKLYWPQYAKEWCIFEKEKTFLKAKTISVTAAEKGEKQLLKAKTISTTAAEKDKNNIDHNRKHVGSCCSRPWPTSLLPSWPIGLILFCPNFFVDLRRKKLFWKQTISTTVCGELSLRRPWPTSLLPTNQPQKQFGFTFSWKCWSTEYSQNVDKTNLAFGSWCTGSRKGTQVQFFYKALQQ